MAIWQKHYRTMPPIYNWKHIHDTAPLSFINTRPYSCIMSIGHVQSSIRISVLTTQYQILPTHRRDDLARHATLPNAPSNYHCSFKNIQTREH